MRFSDKFSEWLRIFDQNFSRLLYVRIYAKLQNFIQLQQRRFPDIKRTQAAETDLDLLTCPSEGPNTSSQRVVTDAGVNTSCV